MRLRTYGGPCPHERTAAAGRGNTPVPLSAGPSPLSTLDVIVTLLFVAARAMSRAAPVRIVWLPSSNAAPLARTSSPAAQRACASMSQSMSSRLSTATSPARSPRSRSVRITAQSRRPNAVRLSQDLSRHSTSELLIPLRRKDRRLPVSISARLQRAGRRCAGGAAGRAGAAAAGAVGRRAPGRAARTNRFGFHDLLRLYARQRAEQDDPARERQQAIQRLLGWYLHTADNADRLIYPAGAAPARALGPAPGAQQPTSAAQQPASATARSAWVARRGAAQPRRRRPACRIGRAPPGGMAAGLRAPQLLLRKPAHGGLAGNRQRRPVRRAGRGRLAGAGRCPALPRAARYFVGGRLHARVGAPHKRPGAHSTSTRIG